MKKEPCIINALMVISTIVILCIPVLFCHIKARQLNKRYGTDFTLWDIMLGVEKNYRDVE